MFSILLFYFISSKMEQEIEISKRRRVNIFNPTGGTCINTLAGSQPLINKDEFKSFEHLKHESEDAGLEERVKRLEDSKFIDVFDQFNYWFRINTNFNFSHIIAILSLGIYFFICFDYFINRRRH
jgi:hypothetical protein